MGKKEVKKITKNILAKIKEFKKKVNVERALIFGSYARGEVTKHSDMDLILIGERFEGKSFHDRFKGLWLKWKLGIPVDFLCYTPKEFEESKRKISIVREAVKEGIEI